MTTDLQAKPRTMQAVRLLGLATLTLVVTWSLFLVGALGLGEVAGGTVVALTGVAVTVVSAYRRGLVGAAKTILGVGVTSALALTYVYGVLTVIPD